MVTKHVIYIIVSGGAALSLALVGQFVKDGRAIVPLRAEVHVVNGMGFTENWLPGPKRLLLRACAWVGIALNLYRASSLQTSGSLRILLDLVAELVSGL